MWACIFDTPSVKGFEGFHARWTETKRLLVWLLLKLFIAPCWPGQR